MLHLVKTRIHRLLRLYREHMAKKTVEAHCGEIFVGGRTRLSSKTRLGRNPSFNGFTVNGHGRLTIGDNFHSGTDCLIITSIHNYDSGTCIPYDETHIPKDVVIGDNVWFGDRVLVIGSVTIGNGAIIQAGAVVVKDVPELAIAGGNPATVFKYRDREHYNRLVADGKFH